MCGRFDLDRSNKEIDRIVQALAPDAPAVKYGEIAPTNNAPVLGIFDDMIAPKVMAWGFPRWDGKGVIFNARAECALHKPMFRKALRERPLAVPTTGFFEWRSSEDKKSKEKFLFRSSDPVLFLAGFWSHFPDDPLPYRFNILTTDANDAMLPFHNRMPVILAHNELEGWLAGKSLDRVLSKIPPPLHATSISPAR